MLDSQNRLLSELCQMNEIAKKHIDLSIETKEIAKRAFNDCQVYIATYTTGRAGKDYQYIEEQSGKEFWSIKAWTTPPHHRLKDPDVLITLDDRVRYFVEIKWGTVLDNPRTDIVMGIEEWMKIDRLLRTSNVMCRVRGPAATEGRRFRTSEFLFEKDFTSDINSKLVLVSDFFSVKQKLPKKFEQFIELWRKTCPSLLIADINARVGEIPPFAEILSR
jgi:hypothetical protein